MRSNTITQFAALNACMEKRTLEPLIKQGLSTRGIARTLGISPTNARYWLRKQGLKAQYQRGTALRKCSRCGEDNPDKFYGHKRTVCGACHNAYTTQQGQNKRLRAIKEIGGQCCVCSFNKYYCSLDFHHKDPTAKDPNFRSMRGWSWEHITKELEKCVLLCKNCHAAVHAGLLKI